MGKKFFLLGLVTLLFVCGPLSGKSAADELEKGIIRDIQESKVTLAKAAVKLQSGTPATAEIASLRSLAESIRASHLLMGERLRQHGEKAASLGAKATARQSLVTDAYAKAIEDYLALIDALPPDGTATPEAFATLKNLLDRLLPPKKRPLHGTLPYRQTAYAPVEPAITPAITPAYRGGNREVVSADTASSSEAPLSAAIVAKAQDLQWNPVLIYEWVKNSVATEWYRGVMKGAEETLRQKSGNDADQAALLVALLRASGFPSRYVRGSIELFPDISKARSLTGLSDPLQIADFFRKAGIPFKPVIAGGSIVNFQLEHIWVESQIPYSNYRGAVIDAMGKTWLALDTSIKPHGLAWNSPLQLPGNLFEPLRDDYLQTVRSDTPLEFVRAKTTEYLQQNSPDTGYQDLLGQGSIVPDVLKILPASLQFKQFAITGEYTELPAELQHRVRFTATANGNELFSIPLETHKLSNKKLALRAEPETVEDQQIIDSFGGLDNTPAYLVRLRPALTLDGERLVVAQDGLSMGSGFTLDIDIVTPNGAERVTSGQIAGNLAIIGVVAQNAVTPAAIGDEDDAETILHKEAIGYIDRWNKGEVELAALLGQRLSRPAVAIAIVGNQLEVTSLMGTPFDMQWQGVYLDAGYRRIAATGNTTIHKQFLQLSALQGSVLEHRIFEDDFKVDSISTAKLLQLAKADNVPVLSIDKTNSDELLPALTFDAAVKEDIANAINQNLTVTIPQNEIAYRDWSGIGYIKENKDTGEAGWMLSGQVAGGMTALSRGKWRRQDIVAILAKYARVATDLWSTGPLQVRSLGDSGSVPLLQAVGSFDADGRDRAVTKALRQAVSREYFKTHGDVDFLVILTTFDYAMPETDADGFYQEVKNDTSGIGRELFDESSAYGSSGKLQGVIDLGNITPPATPESERLEETVATLAHELSHRFGAYVRLKNADNTLNNTLLGKDNAHWSYLLDTKGSLLYGNGWQTNPDGSFTATNVRNSYSPLDLYLMGMLPKEQVPPMLLIDNPSIDRAKLPRQGDTITGSARTITIDDIISAEGERSPDYATAPKEFTIGYVLLKRPGDDSSAAAQRVELLKKAFSARFRELTASKGSISGTLPEVALSIDTPADNAVITGPSVTVQGTIVNTTTAETGVIVNGIPATVTGSRFIANHVPLQEWTNTLTVIATDINGLTTTNTRTVTAQAGHYLRISSTIDSGTAPLEISLRLDSSMPLDGAIVWHPDTPAVTQLPADNPEEYRYRITAEGTYGFTAEITDEGGQVYRDTVLVTVIAKEKLDSLLKGKWEGMKAAMTSGNIEKSLSFVSEPARNKYQAVFQSLAENLTEIAEGMRPITYDYVRHDIAEYRITRTETIDNQSVDITYYIYFSKDKNGLWKIDVM